MSIKNGTFLNNLLYLKASVLVLVFVASFGLAQAQRLMDDFKPVIKGYPFVNSFEIDESGNLFVAGRIATIGNLGVNNIAKLNSSGAVDESFKLDTDLGYQFNDIIISSDSIILYINDSRLYVSKKNGIKESFFNPSFSFYNVQAAAIKDDKYIVIAYQVNSNTSSYKLLYLNRNGTIDVDLSTNSLEILSFPKIKVLNNGKTLLAGVTSFNGQPSGTIIQLNDDGTLDDSFENDNTLNGLVEDIEVQTDRKILVVGRFKQFNSTNTQGGLIRLNADGSLDDSFGLSSVGEEFLYYPTSVEIVEDNKLIVGGLTRDENFKNFNKIIRLKTDGSLDNEFPVTRVDRISSGRLFVKTTSDGTIYAAGDVNSSDGQIRPGLIAFDSNGEVLDFNSNLGGVPSVGAVVQQNGKVIIYGSFYEVNNVRNYGICRLNPDGSVDNGFDIGVDLSAPRRGGIRDVEIQSNGKILIGGYFNLDESNVFYELLRFEEDGSLDESFSKVDTEFTINTINIRAGDDIYIGGSFTTINGVAINSLAKLTKDGELINSFNPSNSIPKNSTINEILFLESGSIILGGTLSNFDGLVYKVDEEGNLISSIPTSFLDNNYVNFIKVWGDKLIFGGSRSSGFSTDDNFLFQSNSDLTNFDESAIKAKNALASVFNNVFPAENNKVIIGGRFESINETNRSGVVKVDISGQIDSRFNFEVRSSAGSLGTVGNFVQEDDETLLILGSFTEINGIPFSGIARLKFLNDIPKINSFARILSIEEDGSVELTLDDFDVSDEDDTYSEGFGIIIKPGDNYSSDENTISPNQNFNGTLVVPVAISDGISESEPYEISIEVTPVNDKPIISGFVNIPGVTEGETFNLSIDNFTVTDPDNTFPDDFTLILEAGTDYTLDGLTVIPNAGFNGKLIVKARVNDGELSSDVFEAEVTVVSTNEAPAINGFGGTLSTSEETALTIDLSDFSVTDPDNTFPDDFTLIIESGDNYSVAGSTITPATDFNGTLTVPVKVNDGEADSPTLELFVEVTPVNDAPVILSYVGILTGGEDAPLAFILDGFTVTDPDNTFPTDFSFTLEAGDNYTVDGASILPAANYFGSLSVSATVSDGATSSAPYVIAVTINPVNDNPIITGYSGATTTLEETGLTIDLASLSVTDPDNSFPADFTLEIFESTTYTISGAQITPINDFNGTMTVPVRVSTIDNNSEHFNLTIEVTPVNDVPVIEAYSGELEMDENTSLEFNINSFLVTDPDNTFPEEHSVLVSEGDNYSVNGSSITPTTDFTGELSVPVLVSDGTAASAPNILTITVNEVTGISSLARSVTVFPIPIESELTLKMDNSFVGDFSIRVVDLTGNVVLERKTRKNARSFESVIDLQHLGYGTFVFYVELPGHEMISRRIIIE
ncbi:MAG: tandem-95 repeat protein [Imperialibacter sp.]|uniref:tandem-95 repeat protein n=1 Tax=Imperialibacter sp. TaxID=2038411 RepID=UPI0032EC171C